MLMPGRVTEIRRRTTLDKSLNAYRLNIAKVQILKQGSIIRS